MVVTVFPDDNKKHLSPGIMLKEPLLRTAWPPGVGPTRSQSSCSDGNCTIYGAQ